MYVNTSMRVMSILCVDVALIEVSTFGFTSLVNHEDMKARLVFIQLNRIMNNERDTKKYPNLTKLYLKLPEKSV